ncbi:MAG: BTAD domain-containing putative transcriptional regulator [Acidimicrobiales bacterium]
MVAGAGFGKTTALAQAVRSNLAAPVGTDIWVTLDAIDEDDDRLASAVVAGLDPDRAERRPAVSGEPLDVVVDAITGMAPVDVCLLLDDLHKIPTGSGGHRLIGGLVEALPANGHVVLSSRHRPTIPVARLRASAGVVDIGESELAFSPDEVASLAGMHDEGSDVPPDLGGWPALVTLTLSTNRGFASDFLWEEVLVGLDPAARRALLAMSILGDGSFEEAIAVAGGDVGLADVGEVANATPLVSSDPGRKTFTVHDLWEERTGELFLIEEIEPARLAARTLMAERGQILRLGSMALRWGDDDALLQAAQALVRASLINLPTETGRRWLAAAGPGLKGEPELRLLLLAVEVAERPTDPSVDVLADDVVGAFLSRADGDGLISAATLAITAAHRRGDVGRVLALLGGGRSPFWIGDSPTMRLAFGGADATIAYLSRGAEAALEIIDPYPLDEVATAFTDFVKVLRANWLLEVGRVEEAVEVIGSVEVGDSSVSEFSSYIAWHAGDRSGFADGALGLGDLDAVDLRRRFIRCAEIAEIAASLGDRSTARSARAELAPHVGSHGGALFSGTAAAAMATTYILDHDEEGARSIIDTHLTDFPVDDPIAELQLRRRFATCYLVHEQLAHRWDEVELGPLHERSRAIARLLLQARSGPLGTEAAIDDPDLVITSLPLPWSVELAAAARRDSVPGATDLVDALTATALGPLRSELRSISDDGEHHAAEAAAELLAELPHEDGPVLRIDLLGPMSVSLSGRELDQPELRRARVRTVLALLVVRGPLRRDELIEFVWPDRDLQSARQNLRTTLTYLRRLLEPGGDLVDQPTRLRADGDRISLAELAAIDVDLWEFRRLVDNADRARTTAAGEGSIELLTRALELWRGDPLSDLEDVVGLEADIEHVRSDLVNTSHRCGELLLAAGRFEDALHCADRTRDAAPYSERAHRLAVSALLQLKDRDRLRLRVAALQRLLDELGVEPEASTAMLVARATEFIGAAGHQG